MKNIKLILLLALTAVIGSMGCSTSKMSSETERLAGLCKVWGFLKYYHPNISAGEIDWDKTLMDLWPSFLENDEDQYHQNILNLIAMAGEVEPCQNCLAEGRDTLLSTVDFAWFEDELFNAEISQKLSFILDNKTAFENKYVKPSNLEDADFSLEEAHKDLDTVDVNYRILALFRYWNGMEYFYPYKKLMDKDWAEVLETFIPKFRAEQTEYQYFLNLRVLASHLNDGHSWVVSKRHDSQYAGKYPRVAFALAKIDDQFVVSSYVSDSLARLDSIQIGDKITHIADRPIQEVYAEKKEYTTTQANAVEIENGIFEVLFSGSKRELELTIERNQKVLSMKVTRYTRSELFHKNRVPFPYNYPTWRQISPDISYINMEKMNSDEIVQTVVDSTFHAETLILDFRNYPAFMPFFTLLNHFFEKYPNLQLFTLPSFDNPGYFKEVGHENEMHQSLLLQNKPPVFKGQLILLVSGRTKSRSEFFVSMLQSYPKVTTIGSQTAGSNGNVRSIILPGDITAYFSGMGSYYGNGNQMQRKGMAIDVPVSLTIEGVRSAKDEYLDRAIDFAKQ